MYESKNILIPARPGAEETTLHIKIVTEKADYLTTRPYIFILPGGPGANHSHYKDYECLQDSANIVFYDPRGCGLSAKGTPDSYTMDNYIQDLDIIRQQLGLQEIQLLGKSYGAMCALGYAIRFPKNVTRMVLAAGSPSFRNLDSAKAHLEVHANAEQKAAYETVFNGTIKNQAEMDHYFAVMAPYYSYKKRNNIPTARPLAEYPFSFEPLNTGFKSFLRHFDYEPLLSSIQCKTLVLVGDEDWITSKLHSIKIADNIPDAKLIIFEHSDHSMEDDVPELFFGEIRRFIE
ncbi:MAG: alpha/beta hydrolase [Legionellaceae bacterium]|nr:alpha/beta hydrolase [Legionellaceae bacterium]MBP9776174.1 alpha/beta hydrolase [Legionellaceae bacterium]